LLNIAKGIYDTKFSAVFSKLLEKTRISCYQIGKYTNIDPSDLGGTKIFAAIIADKGQVTAKEGGLRMP